MLESTLRKKLNSTSPTVILAPPKINSYHIWRQPSSPSWKALSIPF